MSVKWIVKATRVFSSDLSRRVTHSLLHLHCRMTIQWDCQGGGPPSTVSSGYSMAHLTRLLITEEFTSHSQMREETMIFSLKWKRKSNKNPSLALSNAKRKCLPLYLKRKIKGRETFHISPSSRGGKTKKIIYLCQRKWRPTFRMIFKGEIGSEGLYRSTLTRPNFYRPNLLDPWLGHIR